MYGFCTNSPYYQMVIENKRKNVVQNIENACKSFQENVCSFANSSSEDICKDFFYMYKYLHEFYYSRDSESTLTNEDFDFLNYWLNVKLKGGNGNASICINMFNRKIKSEGETIISNKIKLGDLHVIDHDNLENMELLYELYNNVRIILNMMRGQDYPSGEQKLCSYYTEDCSTKYKKAMDKCLNDNADFYKALKDFKISYNIAVEQETQDLRKCKSSQYFHLPNYDPVLEKQRNIMAGKILSAPLILSFIIPLLYKYTPFGPFLRAKIKMIKNMWINPDKNESELLLSSTDIEDDISDDGEYNIGYYSEIN
ncbi:PIR Superfamily Protein [Plasmodium ovale wallikeri]|uniref:PIR Superfamily Protein n=1 Tax=Plasmodium ovale wallikeri TaxID=864142 RepID=A0A1A9ALN0_PLAOA|nr:PIR Superfamily Protein [Plasmodium ovale wallikeri]SBT57110.1 PIR Superfamily Protein [Plasmodium ovale wallikeri]